MDPRDQANHYAVVAADGTVESIIVWSGNEHWATPPGTKLFRLSDVKLADEDGVVRLDIGIKLKVLPSVDKELSHVCICYPTRDEKAMIMVECTIVETALAKAEGRDVNQGRIDEHCETLCARIFDERSVMEEPPAPGSDLDNVALVKELVPLHTVAAFKLIREAGVDSIEEELAYAESIR